MRFLRKYGKPLAIFFLVNFLADVFLPTISYAITGHNSMPEYRSFEPVATTNMVNVFDGSFTYNIPLMSVPNGYPITLSYHSNEINNEAQASWVGLGWTLNPGAINRVKRGFPDEFKGSPVTYHSRMPKNWTVTGGAGVGLEFFSKASDETIGNTRTVNYESTGITASLDASVRFNNYQGFGTSFSGGMGVLGGLASLNFTYSQGKVGFSPEINPGALFEKMGKGKSDPKAAGTTEHTPANPDKEANENKNTQDPDKVPDPPKAVSVGSGSPSVKFSIGGVGGGYGGQGIKGTSFKMSPSQPAAFPVSVNPYTGIGLRLKIEAGVNGLPAPIDGESKFSGSYVEQKYDETSVNAVFGYMHSDLAVQAPAAVMDYHTENDKMFEKNDKFLAVPYPNNDLFALSGEALGGTFRAYRSEFGHYRKNAVQSETKSENAGLDFNAPSYVTPVGTFNAAFSLGANIGGDYSIQKIGAWNSNHVVDNSFKQQSYYDYSTNEKFILRFSGDKASVYALGLNDESERAGMNRGVFDAEVDLTTIKNTEIATRNPRSSWVEMHGHEDYQSPNSEYKVHEKDLKIVDGIGGPVTTYDRSVFHKSIGEVVTYNGDGMKYVYGLPVHTKEEKELSYSVKPDEYKLQPANGLIAEITPASGRSIDLNAKRKQGYESDDPYATQFLLTQISSPDYIDRTFNGPTEDDFGSYSRFNYVKVAGGTSNWYQYRSPYEHASFSYNSLSSKGDDMASYSYGEKELYYVHSIASKTHVAIFNLLPRDDGFGADLNSGPGMDELLIGNSNKAPARTLQSLDRIDLYAISDCDILADGFYKPKAGVKPIQSVHFDYDYSLCKGIPNQIITGEGKLTLKKVWFTYNGITSSKITPYYFNYQYPDQIHSPYPAPYNDVSLGIADYGKGLNEHPTYSPVNTDRWGNYRDFGTMAGTDTYHGLGGLAKFFPFVHQNPASAFDPAAWMLKVIKLPSGGEIHVQYEQNDYLYVQDKRAMVMVPLDASTDRRESQDVGSLSQDIKDKRYYLDLNKLGIDNPDLSIAKQLFEPMKDQRMFFSFLYRLIGDGPVNEETINSEYIEGYARIGGYGVDGTGVYFVFKDIEIDDPAYVPIHHDERFNKRELPRKVCKEFYINNRRGLINNNGNALDIDNDDDKEALVKRVFSVWKQVFNLTSECQVFEPGKSFVRLQMPVVPANGILGKKGGGVRVKRVMMYDENAVSGKNSLYGTEYDYTKEEVIEGVKVLATSGVATNEPGVGRRESPLVHPLEKDQQSKFEAILYGQDMYGNEGPIGEYLLPAPSIGYSQVTIRSIHKTGTTTGYEMHEYHTCKDFPFEVKNTSINPAFMTPVSLGGGAGPVGISYSRATPHLTQGYAMIQNEMHGQPKRISKYANNSDIALAEEIYDYYAPGESVKVMDENLNQTDVVMGMEREMLAETREVYELSTGLGIGADLTTGAWGTYPVPVPAVLPTFFIKKINFSASFHENILRTHVINKIIKYPVLIKSVTNVSDGVRNISENLVFDKYSGNPVVVKSYDDFKQQVIKQDFMASWQYKNMRSKSVNQGLKFTGTFESPNFLQLNSANCGVLQNFSRGDLLEISGTALYHIEDLDYGNNRLILVASGLNAATPASGALLDFVILRSGNTNQVNVKAGSIAMNGQEGYATSTIFPEVSSEAIKHFEDLLNSKLQLTGPEISIDKLELHSGLKLINPVDGTCINAQADLPKPIYLMKTDNKVSVQIGKRKTALFDEPCENHPAVEYLNNFLNSTWGMSIPSDAYAYQYWGKVHPEYECMVFVDNWYLNHCLNSLNVSFSCINNSTSNLSSFFSAEDNSFKGYRKIGSSDPWRLTTIMINDFPRTYMGNFDNTTSSGYSLLTTSPYGGGIWVVEEDRLASPDNEYYEIDHLFNKNYTSVIGYFDQDPDGYLIYKKWDTYYPLDVTTYRFQNIKFYNTVSKVIEEPLCQSPITISPTGKFKYNPRSRYIEYIDGSCSQPIFCFEVCSEASSSPVNISNVVTASAATFSDDWSYNAGLYPVSAGTYSPNAYESGMKGKWRMESQFTFRSTTSNAQNLNSGRFTLQLFNWKNPENNPAQWVKVSTIDKYSPNGEPLEDHNILNIYSTAKYGYNNTLPVLVAQNSKDHSVVFEGYENRYSYAGMNFWEDGITHYTNHSAWTVAKAHTGKYSVQINRNEDITIGSINANEQTRSEGMIVRGWFYTAGKPGSLSKYLKALIGTDGALTGYSMNYISSAGEWQLYEAIIPPNTLDGAQKIAIRLDNSFVGTVYMDDVRAQPVQSEMACYVYDKAQRLIAVLDDQHYALLYQYNAEGLLIRKLKETKEGVKTFSETQYNSRGALE